MTRAKYKALRSKLYKAAGEVGTEAEGSKFGNLHATYRRLSEALDAFDLLGVQLGFVDEMTNELIDGRVKREKSAVDLIAEGSK